MKKVTEFLQVRSAMRSIYYYTQPLFLPKDKKKCLSIGNVEALFYINTPVDLIMVENPFLDEGAGGEKQVLQILLDNIKYGDIVFDIGANIGVHTVFMAKKVGENGRVVAFEPEKSNFEKLMLNINLNGLRNVISLQTALGHIFEEGMLYQEGSWATLVKPSENSIGQKIKIAPGDYLVQNENLSPPNVVKIDVEGYEYYVIKGLQKTLINKICRMICCEIHPTKLPPDITQENVIELLRTLGFNRIETSPRGETFHAFCYKS
jgi:FkbM family methyltransferase